MAQPQIIVTSIAPSGSYADTALSNTWAASQSFTSANFTSAITASIISASSIIGVGSLITGIISSSYSVSSSRSVTSSYSVSSSYSISSSNSISSSYATTAGSVLSPTTYAYNEISGSYLITSTDYTINCVSNSFIVNLPTSVGIAGKIYNIKNTSSGSITVSASLSETIDGSSNQTFNQWTTLTVQSTGANWIII